MKKFLLLALLPLFLISCGDDDKNSFTGPVESTITKNELESAPSFTYKDFSNNVLSIKFRNGKLYTKEVTSSGFVCNENVMTYSLNGEMFGTYFVCHCIIYYCIYYIKFKHDITFQISHLELNVL